MTAAVVLIVLQILMLSITTTFLVIAELNCRETKAILERRALWESERRALREREEDEP